MSKLSIRQKELLLTYFSEYRKNIRNQITEVYNQSFLNSDKIDDSWRESFKCTCEYIEYIKIKTCVFLKDLIYSVPEFRDEDFLIIFIKEICKFLSVYTWRLDSKTNISEFEKQSKQQKHYLIWFNDLYKTHKALKKAVQRYKQKTKIQQPEEKRKRKRIGQPVEMAVEIKRISEIPEKEFDQKIKKRRKKIKCQEARKKHKQLMQQATLMQISVNCH
ncbi:MAG: hypothetical protein IKN73_04410 [Alphaproteobacteria bacterium]|nr:hypothetical protein [Alphaproteobacteria bacterium]